MNNQEDRLQAGCVRWFRYQYPGVVIFAIPNGGSRNAIEAAKMKGTGTLAGVADLFVMCARKSFHGFFIEMKAGKNIQSPAQKEFERKATEEGYAYHVCRSFEEFQMVIEIYLGK